MEQSILVLRPEDTNPVLPLSLEELPASPGSSNPPASTKYGAAMLLVHTSEAHDNTVVELCQATGRREGSLHGFSVHTNIKLLLI